MSTTDKTNNKNWILVNKYVLLLLDAVILALGGLVFYFNHKANTSAEKFVETVEQDGIYIKRYYERQFSELKNENRELYDSLKSQQKEIESLTQFRYKVKYSTDTIYVDRETPIAEELKELPDNTYSYDSETDTLSYRLEINSKLEPNWYKLSADVKDKFTIVNKDHGNGQQSTFIETENGEISDITVWQKPHTTKWYERFSFGPTIGAGYDPVNKGVGVFVGIGVTYNILGK